MPRPAPQRTPIEAAQAELENLRARLANSERRRHEATRMLQLVLAATGPVEIDGDELADPKPPAGIVGQSRGSGPRKIVLDYQPIKGRTA